MARIRVDVYGAARFGGAGAVRLVRLAAKKAFWYFAYDFDASVDVSLTDNNGIWQKNWRHRNVDRPTDVLSFPMADFSAGSPAFDASFAGGGEGRVMLGDIVLSVEKAAAQAMEYGHSFERECAYLTVHSMLHLLGFDHEAEGDQRIMRGHEEEIMGQLGLERK